MKKFYVGVLVQYLIILIEGEWLFFIEVSRFKVNDECFKYSIDFSFCKRVYFLVRVKGLRKIVKVKIIVDQVKVGYVMVLEMSVDQGLVSKLQKFGL